MLGLKGRKTGCVLAAAILAMLLAACGPDGAGADSGAEAGAAASAGTTAPSDGGDESEDVQGTAAETEISVSVNNDTVELGTLAVFEPSDNLDVNSGVAIAGSGEEQLQQERIAGGAVGAVVSENLEPLHGITDYSEGEYVAVYGVEAE